MRFVLVFLFFVFTSGFKAQSTDTLDLVRANYDKFISNRSMCEQMISSLEKEKSNPISLAYLGALQAVWANHVMSPIKKLNTFNKGKKNIELAVSQAPNNAEIRFVRFSIQNNVPGFLGYSKNKKEDLEFLRKNKTQIKSKKILNLLNQELSE